METTLGALLPRQGLDLRIAFRAARELEVGGVVVGDGRTEPTICRTAA